MLGEVERLRELAKRCLPMQANGDGRELWHGNGPGGRVMVADFAGYDEYVEALDAMFRSAAFEEMVRDAGRYRHLRNRSHGQWEHPIVVEQKPAPFDTMIYIGPMFGDELDTAIDTAMSAEGAE